MDALDDLDVAADVATRHPTAAGVARSSPCLPIELEGAQAALQSCFGCSAPWLSVAVSPLRRRVPLCRVALWRSRGARGPQPCAGKGNCGRGASRPRGRPRSDPRHQLHGPGPIGRAPQECLPLMPRLKPALEHSRHIANELDVPLRGHEHALAGIVVVPDSMAVEILRRLCVSAANVQRCARPPDRLAPQRFGATRRRYRRLRAATR
jgi:hypothetical protein